MKNSTIASLLSLLVSVPAFAQSTAAPAPAPAPPMAAGPSEPETLVGRRALNDGRLTGWFIAPTFETTSFANTLAYGPGVRAGIYLNRRLAIGATVNTLALQESHFGDHQVTNVGTYGGLLLQYVVQSNRLVHVSVESTLASGRWCAVVGDGQQGTHDGCDGRNFVAFEPVANVEVNFASHVRLATGVGYRFAAAATGNGPDGGDMSGLVARTSLVFGSF